MIDLTYENVEKHAKALKELGIVEILLRKKPYPWHLTDRFITWGINSSQIPAKIRFYSKVTDEGLNYSWDLDLEKRENDSKKLLLDVEIIKEILGKLKGEPKIKFKKHLLSCVNFLESSKRVCRKKINKYNESIKILTDLGNL